MLINLKSYRPSMGDGIHIDEKIIKILKEEHIWMIYNPC